MIVAREFLVTSLRLVAADEGVVIAANKWGKAKTVSQIVAIALILVMQYVQELVAMGVLSAFTMGGLPSSAIFLWAEMCIRDRDFNGLDRVVIGTVENGVSSSG